MRRSVVPHLLGLALFTASLGVAGEPVGEAAASVTAGAGGFALKSADGAFQLKLRGYFQVDGRLFPGADRPAATDTILLRRARPILEATLYRIFDVRLMPDFGDGKTVLQDAYLEARFSPALRLRAGKFKAPVGLERLQSATDLAFVERALPTNLVPNRDLGVQASGDLAGEKLSYAAGLFDGAADGASLDGDSNDAKDVAARLFWRPFLRDAKATPTIDLGLGLAATNGNHEGTVAFSGLPAYRTAGQQSFFSYRSDGSAAGTTIADGESTRLAPEAWLYAGSFGLMAEWVESEQEVARGESRRSLAHTAWEATASWVLTGEKIGYRGVAPRRGFDHGSGGWGALILSVRASGLKIDPATFPTFADPTRAARSATAWGVGISWNLHPGIRWMLDYEQTSFDGGDASGDRENEKVLFSRLQLAF